MNPVGLIVGLERHESYIQISCGDRDGGNHSGHTIPTQAVP